MAASSLAKAARSCGAHLEAVPAFARRARAEEPSRHPQDLTASNEPFRVCIRRGRLCISHPRRGLEAMSRCDLTTLEWEPSVAPVLRSRNLQPIHCPDVLVAASESSQPQTPWAGSIGPWAAHRNPL